MEPLNRLQLVLKITGLRGGGDDLTIKLRRYSKIGQSLYFSDSLALNGHDGPIKTLAFSPDGHELASGSGDQTVRIWRLDRPAEAPIVLRDHEEWVESITFSPMGDTLVSGSIDRSVRIWKINPAQLASEICGSVNRSLTPEEWVLSAGVGIDYPNSCGTYKLEKKWKH